MEHISKIRRVIPTLISSNDIVGVSPMEGLIGLISEMRQKYKELVDEKDKLAVYKS